MGWLHGWDSKQELVDHLTDPKEFSSALMPKHRLVGNHLWLVLQGNEKADKPWATVMLCLISCDKGQWGYKDMDESAGPSYYDCPVLLIKLVESMAGGEPPNEYAKNWRQKCRDYAARRKENSKPKVAGTVVELYGKQYKLMRKLAPRQGWEVLASKDNLYYRMTAKHINQASIISVPTGDMF